MSEKNIINAVMEMNPVVFYYKGKLDDGVKHYGFIAQELEEVFPSGIYGLVTEDGNGNKMVRYHEVIPMLVKYVQFMEKRIDILEKNVGIINENKFNKNR